MTTASKIPLAKLIAHIRDELIKANSEGEGKDLRFLAEEIELEMKIGVTASDTIKGAVDVWVFSLGADDSYKNEQVQVVRMKLKPTDSEGGTYKTSGVEPRD